MQSKWQTSCLSGGRDWYFITVFMQNTNEYRVFCAIQNISQNPILSMQKANFNSILVIIYLQKTI